jgi:hypothetical protein
MTIDESTTSWLEKQRGCLGHRDVITRHSVMRANEHDFLKEAQKAIQSKMCWCNIVELGDVYFFAFTHWVAMLVIPI